MNVKKLFQNILLVIVLIACTIRSNGQQRPTLVEVTFNKTTTVVFPNAIASVDRGSRDLLAQKAKGVDNVLQLKAAREHFLETNLTVITSDGKIRDLVVRYVENPASMVQYLDSDSDLPTALFSENMTKSEIINIASKVSTDRRRVHGVFDKSFGVTMVLMGVYINGEVIFYHFRLSNDTNISYDVEYGRSFVHDLKQAKRTASQEVDVTPLLVFGDVESVPGNSFRDVVYVLPKFTIPDAKQLVFEIFEKNGARNLKLRIKNKTIVAADLVY